MRRAFLLALVIVVRAASSPAETPAKPAEIPDVRSLSDLRTLSAAHVLEHWDIRLGLCDAGNEAGPWRLLYTHTKYIGPPDSPRRLAAPGVVPAGARAMACVSFTLERSAERRRPAMARVRRSPPTARGKDDERLYAAALPAAYKGDWVVTVWSPKGKAIARRALRVAADETCAWRVFACRVGRQRYAVERVCRPAMPIYPSSRPIWTRPAGKQVEFLRAARGKVGFLPGRLPPWPGYEPRYFDGLLVARRKGEFRYPLRLTREGGDFVVRSRAAMIDWPGKLLLARWWVNGKPAASKPPRKAIEEARELPHQVRDVRELRVELAVPAGLGRLRAGDKLALQVMYTEGGYELVRPPSPPQAMIRADGRHRWPAYQPMLSNRLEVVVTKAILDAGR
jgi:hypothetical protein